MNCGSPCQVQTGKQDVQVWLAWSGVKRGSSTTLAKASQTLAGMLLASYPTRRSINLGLPSTRLAVSQSGLSCASQGAAGQHLSSMHMAYEARQLLSLC